MGKSALTQAFHSDGTHFPKNYTMVSYSVYNLNDLTCMNGLLTKCAGYWPSSFFECLRNEMESYRANIQPS